VSAPAYRATALAWLAARGTWRLSDAIGWLVEHLVAPGFLAPWRDEDAPFLWEQRHGVVLSGPPHESFAPSVIGNDFDPDESSGAASEPIVRATEFPRVLEAAHARVRAELRGLFAHPPRDTFVHAALYARRVVRENGRWTVRLTCEASMSDQVLALLAADLLRDRAPYDEELVVCEVCPYVGFEPACTWRERTECSRHRDD
jgi:hypothetical protein